MALNRWDRWLASAKPHAVAIAAMLESVRVSSASARDIRRRSSVAFALRPTPAWNNRLR
jgi:hypothetical protein